MDRYTLNDYYEDYITYHYNPNDDDNDSLHTYCDNEASVLSYTNCIFIINEWFDNQLEAIQSYINEYGEIPIYDNDVNRTHHILAFHAMMEYMRNRLDDEDNDALSQASTVD